MIAKHELRIGSYFTSKKAGYMSNPGIQKVESIGFRGVNQWQDMGASGELTFGQINPIPLTPEILEKAGFVFKGSLWFHTTLDLPVAVEYVGNHCQLKAYGRYVGKPFQYLHQLQNIVFAWIGEELKVQL